MTATITDATLTLPLGWFPVPLDGDDSLPWVADAVRDAGRIAADAGLTQTLPGWDAALAEALHGVRLGLKATLDDGATAAVWVPSPGLGAPSAVAVVQIRPVGADRSPERYSAALLAPAHAPDPGEEYLHAEALEGAVPAGPVVGAHLLVRRASDVDDVAEVEERTAFGVFPPDASDMIEILFVSEHAGAFVDMPDETLQLVAELELTRRETT